MNKWLLGNWLTRERAYIYFLLISVLSLISALHTASIFLLPALHDPDWRPLPVDFDAFWSGARLALEGHAPLAYDPVAMQAAQRVSVQPPPVGGYYAYMYPPMFLMLSMPLGLLPYLVAMPIFVVAGYTAFSMCLRHILPSPWPWLAVLAFPPAMTNAVFGQNGLVTATCFGLAMLLLADSPALAGGVLGLLAFKPHLAVCVPLGLVAARRWRACIACAGAAAALVLLSWAVLGTATWASFLASFPVTEHVLRAKSEWQTNVSVYAAARVVGGGNSVALAAQAVFGLGAMACVVLVCRKRRDPGAEISTITAAALLCAPHLVDYDLACLAVPMAWLARRGAASGWRPGEKIVIGALLLYTIPTIGRILSVQASLPLAPFLIAALLGLVVRRTLSDPAQKIYGPTRQA